MRSWGHRTWGTAEDVKAVGGWALRHSPLGLHLQPWPVLPWPRPGLDLREVGALGTLLPMVGNYSEK